ncbi:MAG: protoporphyrinogen oxidase [Candidatus Zixiibacteriota bacterium]|nr:MAG: protoporphyrinogen oxidase [candidate division Zixibacteria bacterium]
MADGVAKRRVVIVGAGVAGLSTAFLIREKIREIGSNVDMVILEAKPYAGGSTRTDLVNGYTCEWGPNGFLDNEPLTLRLIKMLGMEDRLIRANEASSRRFIYHNGKMREIALNPVKFIKSDIVSLPIKLRMALEYFIPARKNGDDETVYEFGRRRLGAGFAKYLLDPMVSGIFAGNTKELSLKAVFPKMVEMEKKYGGLFKAMFARQKETRKNGKKQGGPAGPGGTLHTFKYGMGELTETLAEKLKTDLRLSSPVKSVVKEDGKFTVITENDKIKADYLVLACPSYETSRMIRDIDKKVAGYLDEIEFAPVDVVCHGFKSENVGRSVDGFGVLVPRSEGIRSLGTLWSDSIFPGQAPDGYHLFRTILGGACDPEIVNLEDDALNDVAKKDLARLIDITNEPYLTKVFRHPKGIAQYTIGHLNKVAATERMERVLPGLCFTGVSYRGVSVNGCIKDAFRVADKFRDLEKSR